MESAIFGLIGVVVGSVLTTLKEFWFETRKRKKDAVFLATHVSTLLDRFVERCVDVARDDGLLDGQRDEQGCKSPQVEVPRFEPHIVQVEWKSLDAQLMYDVLDFPNRVIAVERSIQATTEYVAGPPDFEEFFEERRIQYSGLGIEAAQLALRLRREGGIVARPERHWSPVDQLQGLQAGALAHRADATKRLLERARRDHPETLPADV